VWIAAVEMLAHNPLSGRITLGGNRGYHTRGFVRAAHELKITLQVAQNDSRRPSVIDGRTTRHGGSAVSQRKRKPCRRRNGKKAR
jgi:hypothetical protein